MVDAIQGVWSSVVQAAKRDLHVEGGNTMKQQRNGRGLWAVGMLIVMGLGTLFSLGVASSAALGANSPGQAEVEFTTALSLDEALSLAQEHDLTITQLYHSFTVGDQV